MDELRLSQAQYQDVDLCPANFGDVVEGEKTYKTVADIIKKTGSCLVGWNDQDLTHFDILFTLKPQFKGNIQGGINPPEYLFVSIMRIGAFAFKIKRQTPLFVTYVDEKLGYAVKGLGTPTKQRITDLINGILTNL